MSAKDLLSKIYKGVINSTAKEKVKQVFKMVTELKHEFHKEEIPRANRHVKRRSYNI